MLIIIMPVMGLILAPVSGNIHTPIYVPPLPPPLSSQLAQKQDFLEKKARGHRSLSFS